MLMMGGRDYEIPEFLQSLPLDLRERVAGTSSVDPATAPLAEMLGSVGSILQGYQREHDQRLVSRGLEKAAVGGPAPLGLESCLWAGRLTPIHTLLIPDGVTIPAVASPQPSPLAPSPRPPPRYA